MIQRCVKDAHRVPVSIQHAASPPQPIDVSQRADEQDRSDGQRPIAEDAINQPFDGSRLGNQSVSVKTALSEILNPNPFFMPLSISVIFPYFLLKSCIISKVPSVLPSSTIIRRICTSSLLLLINSRRTFIVLDSLKVGIIMHILGFSMLFICL